MQNEANPFLTSAVFSQLRKYLAFHTTVKSRVSKIVATMKYQKAGLMKYWKQFYYNYCIEILCVLLIQRRMIGKSGRSKGICPKLSESRVLSKNIHVQTVHLEKCTLSFGRKHTVGLNRGESSLLNSPLQSIQKQNFLQQQMHLMLYHIHSYSI